MDSWAESVLNVSSFSPLHRIPPVNTTIMLLPDWTVWYTRPTHSYQWQLVFSAFTCSPLSDTKHSWVLWKITVQADTLSHWSSAQQTADCEDSFPFCSQSQDAPPTAIWGWVMCCFTAEDGKRLIFVRPVSVHNGTNIVFHTANWDSTMSSNCEKVLVYCENKK